MTTFLNFKDQIDHLVKNKIVAETINSKMTVEERKRVFNDLRAKCPNTQLLYITPEQAATDKFQQVGIAESLMKELFLC